MRLVVVYVRHGMRRLTGLAVAGMLTATFAAGCSPSSAGQLGGQASNANCAGSTETDKGFGAGPAYLSGQSSWYAGGQAAILRVDSKYSGPLLVRASQFAGMVEQIAEVLAPRTGRPSTDFAVRNLAGAVVGVLMSSVLAAASDRDADLTRLADAALAHLESGLPLS
jgi:MftR C-terminal domain